MSHFKSEFLFGIITEKVWQTFITEWAVDHLLNSQVSSQAFPVSALYLWNTERSLWDSRTPLLTFPQISLGMFLRAANTTVSTGWQAQMEMLL